MPSYVTPKKNVEYIFYIGLTDQADTKLLKANPTIAAGDFKVSIDGGSFNNPSTLPSVTPASGKAVKCTLSTSEMNGDNIIFVASDSAGAEWCDQIINIQTSARQIDDLAFPTTSGRSIDVTTTGGVGIDWSNVENPTTSLALTGTTISTTQIVASVSGNVGGNVVGNVNGNVVGSVGSVTTVGSVTGNIGGNLLGTLSTTERNAIADANLNRDMSAVTVTNARSPINALRALRNKTDIAATVLTVYEEDDATPAWTAALTLNSSAVPVTGVDPV